MVLCGMPAPHWHWVQEPNLGAYPDLKYTVVFLKKWMRYRVREAGEEDVVKEFRIIVTGIWIELAEFLPATQWL